MAREEFENMKVKSLVTLGVTLLLIVLIGLLAAVVGTQTAEKLLRKAELPVKLRRLFPSSQFARGLKSKRDSIERAVYAQLTKGLEPPTEETRRMVKTIAESIESQLTAMMRRATLRIH